MTNARLINSSAWLKMNSFNVYFLTHASLRLIVLWQMSFNVITSLFMRWGGRLSGVFLPVAFVFWIMACICKVLLADSCSAD